jgi:hypothetical protein
MNASARKPAQPAAGAKPNAAAEDKRHAERLWELYVKAFEGLLDRHCCVPAEQYQTAGDREWESAQAIANAAMTLAICAAAKWKAYEAAYLSCSPAAARRVRICTPTPPLPVGPPDVGPTRAAFAQSTPIGKISREQLAAPNRPFPRRPTDGMQISARSPHSPGLPTRCLPTRWEYQPPVGFPPVGCRPRDLPAAGNFAATIARPFCKF